MCRGGAARESALIAGGDAREVTHVPRRALIQGSLTLVSLSLRLKDLLGRVTRVKKKKKKRTHVVEGFAHAHEHDVMERRESTLLHHFQRQCNLRVPISTKCPALFRIRQYGVGAPPHIGNAPRHDDDGSTTFSARATWNPTAVSGWLASTTHQK